jgi:hypothetical protein
MQNPVSWMKILRETSREELITMIITIFYGCKFRFLDETSEKREREREELHTRMLTISQLLQVCFSLASFFFLLHFVEMCVSYNIFFSLLHFVEDVMHHLYY